VHFDPDKSFVVRAAKFESTQGYTPFEGQELNGKLMSTCLRGHLIHDKSKVVGPPRGKHLQQTS
jgi:allantoinase